MEIKVVGVHSVAAEKDSPQGEWCQRIANLERDCMKRVADPSTQIVMRFPTWGLRDCLDGFYHALTNRLNERSVYHQVIAAEKEGFDAAIIVCLFDPLLRELRTAVDIPVIGLAEASMHMANIIGAKFGVISFTNQTALDTDTIVDTYGLRQKCVGVIAMKDLHTGWLAATMESPPETVERTIEQIEESARELIKRGAEVILIG